MAAAYHGGMTSNKSASKFANQDGIREAVGRAMAWYVHYQRLMP